MPSLINALPMFFVVLGAMIFVHELGHFLVAKWLGIRVEVFSLGFGKRLIGFKRGDTDYRVSLLPLGGYVKMAGDNIAEERAGAPDEFLSHSKWHRFLVAIAGPVMNILTALLIPVVISMNSYSVPEFKSEPPIVANVKPDSTAAAAGLQVGDRIVAFNGTETPTWRDLDDQVLLHPGQTVTLTVDRNGVRTPMPVEIESTSVSGEKVGLLAIFPNLPDAYIGVHSVLAGKPAEAAGLRPGDRIVAVNGAPVGADQFGLIRVINSNAGNTITLSIERNGAPVEIKATPALEDGNGKLGFQPEIMGIRMKTEPLGFRAACAYSIDTNVRFMRMTWAAFSQIVAGQRSASSALAGPIGIAEIVGQAADQGYQEVFDLMGLLSLNLGIFNLLPIPVLDGGLIFMLALEAVLGFFGRQLSLAVKERMINVGLVLIVLLIGFVIFNDFRKHIIGPAMADDPAQQSAPAPEPPPPPAPVVPAR